MEFFTRGFDRSTLEFEPSGLKLEPFKCRSEGVDGKITK
jgi:hypothetical protein